MKKKKRIILCCVLTCLVFAFGGCAGTVKESSEESWTDGQEAGTEGDRAESWAYIHEPGTEILRLENDGKAVYKGENYDYIKDEGFITLTDGQGRDLKMRYVEEEGSMLLYERTAYQYREVDGVKRDGLIGLWEDEEEHWTYEFTAKGTFLEDKIFPGYYFVDEEAGTIKLVYNDHFEDTYVYYQIDGDELIIEYPWPMVRTTDAAADARD